MAGAGPGKWRWMVCTHTITIQVFKFFKKFFNLLINKMIIIILHEHDYKTWNI